MEKKAQGRKMKIVIAAAVLAAIVAAVVLQRAGILFGSSEKTVGNEIKKQDITEFYWTLASSANPPEFLRYCFYVKDGAPFFHYERREGDVWPLTEEYVTDHGDIRLSEEQWDGFFSLISGGLVIEREDDTKTGAKGPWTYIYWAGDKDKYQQYSFEDYEKEKVFVELCEELVRSL